ncbi:hypothetical protein PINS_up004495 [Pythium insidiosum]|nr:hypothetical protein PINS_up004495 [Pythium insidiosum]
MMSAATPFRVIVFLASMLLTLSPSGSVSSDGAVHCSIRGTRFRGRGIRLDDDLLADCGDDGSVVCYRMSSNGKTDAPCEGVEDERGLNATASNDTPLSQRCRVGDVEFGGLGHYLVGGFRRRGSVFADCVDGVAICYEDDALADASSKRIPCDAAELAARRRRLGVFANTRNATWPHRIVCVHWVASFARATKELWFQAFQEYLKKTGIPLCVAQRLPRALWRQDAGVQQLPDYSTFLHELGHVVGLFHEHSHPQREVIVLRDKMDSISSINYAVATRDEASTTQYERRSVMHYSVSALCIPKNPKLRYCDVTETKANGCVEPKEQHCDPKQQSTFGQTSQLTPKDVDAINKMYEKVPRHPNSPAPRSRSFRGVRGSRASRDDEEKDEEEEAFEWSDFSSREDTM